MSGWVAVDLDGTLAFYDGWKGSAVIGEPIPTMVERVRAWLANGQEVRIFTARVWTDGSHARNADADAALAAIQAWCYDHIGTILPVTCVKDFAMVELWDDRAVRVVQNEGRPCCGDAL